MPFKRKKEEEPVGTVYTLQEALRRGLVSFELRGVHPGDPSHMKTADDYHSAAAEYRREGDGKAERAAWRAAGGH